MKKSINLFDEKGWQSAAEYPENTRKKILREKSCKSTIFLLSRNCTGPHRFANYLNLIFAIPKFRGNWSSHE